jgi:hypothetical protein
MWRLPSGKGGRPPGRTQHAQFKPPPRPQAASQQAAVLTWVVLLAATMLWPVAAALTPETQDGLRAGHLGRRSLLPPSPPDAPLLDVECPVRGGKVKVQCPVAHSQQLEHECLPVGELLESLHVQPRRPVACGLLWRLGMVRVRGLQLGQGQWQV